MPRVKSGIVSHRRRKKILKLAKGYFGSKHALYKTAHEQVMRSLAFAYRDRKQRKRDFRKLWIQRINAACRANGTKYSSFINGLTRANVLVNRKMLADLAISDPAGFANLVKVSNEGLKITKSQNTEVLVDVSKTKKVKTPKVENVKKEKKVAVKAEPKIASKKVEKEAPIVEKVEKIAPKAEKVEEVSSNLASLKVAELRELAKAKGISGFSTMKKDELIAALK